MSAASAVNLKRVTLELGGKSPLVVFNDADSKLKSVYELKDSNYKYAGILKLPETFITTEGIWVGSIRYNSIYSIINNDNNT